MPNGCALWRGALTPDGYATVTMRIGGKLTRRGVHRLAYANAHDMLLADVPRLRNTCGYKHCKDHWVPA